MGHATLTNLSKAFVRQIYAKGKVSITEMSAHCVKHKIHLHASEGEYEDEYMIRYGLEEVARFLLESDEGGPFIQATDLTSEQRGKFDAWIRGDIMEWDCGDGNDGDYGILDSIKWKFAPGCRKKYPNDIPLLRYHSN